ncbi:DUF805 domain-containing protein [Vibrio sp. MarTm2]|uniref:DUF805 domain-containing protein n=1 Tax=Vibrio sp. MarTm2 TaxID=2998831 RepID=UPI0022CD545D|nr:DUF805 domain-containing protein [Vibrio sp. MarTm2]MDA0128832.1 DUF805 domain-containing protein [Vibrio sp. MarTm2]
MSIKELLFSFQGRVGRKVYWTWNLVYYIAIFGFGIGMNVLFPAISHLVLPIFLIAALLPDLAITAKRWHDRGKSNWWLLMNVPLIVGRLMAPMDGEPMTSPSTEQMIAYTISLVCGIWIFVECGLLKGQAGDNSYGPEPK